MEKGPRIVRIKRMWPCYASPCLPDADMMNHELRESSEWALLTQALACRTQNRQRIAIHSLYNDWRMVTHTVAGGSFRLLMFIMNP
ncbi:MAG: hypothetical protein MJZ97_01090 [Bacteroidales bacterium]|nr:hypothetical protein [Bacteroidales bacterium]